MSQSSTGPQVQPLLVKILKRIKKEPQNAKFRKLKLEKLAGKLNAASLLALRGHGWVESNGILSLPPDSDGASTLLAKLQGSIGNAETRSVSSSSDGKNSLSESEIMKRLNEAERNEEIVDSINPDSKEVKFWEQNITQVKGAAKMLKEILEAALKAHPRRFSIPTAGVGGIESPLARINACPGSGIAELHAHITKEAEAVAKARASAVDRLASLALSKKRKKKLQAPQQTREIGQQVDVKKLQSMMERIQSISRNITATLRQLNIDEAYSLQWTIGNWRLREVSSKAGLYCPETIKDSKGRRWRAYLQKGLRDPSAPPSSSAGRHDYSVGVYLECTSKSKKMAARVMLRAGLLHARTRSPVYIPGGWNTAKESDFTEEENTWGVSYLTEGGGDSRLAGLGIYDPDKDCVSVRLDFGIGQAQEIEVKKVEKRKTLDTNEMEGTGEGKMEKETPSSVEREELETVKKQGLIE